MARPESGPGLLVWFDPDTELVSLRDLTEDEKSLTLDKQRSVSGLIRSDHAEIIDGCDVPEGDSLGLDLFTSLGDD
jgi:hypothetical protein